MLLEYHFSTLLEKWILEKLPLEQFPLALLATETFQEFVVCYERKLIPRLVFATDRKTLLQVASMLGKSISTLLKYAPFES